MADSSSSQGRFYAHLFRADGKALLPDAREAYLRGTLAPAEAAAVEALLRRDAVERGVTLGRSHELAAQARFELPAREFVPPAWVRQQLRQQASASALGPLRRPVVQAALGLLLLLCAASGVQWVRNKPLVPVPVVMALKSATRTISRATQSLVSAEPLPAEVANDSTWLGSPVAAAPRPARRAAAGSGTAAQAEGVALGITPDNPGNALAASAAAPDAAAEPEAADEAEADSTDAEAGPEAEAAASGPMLVRGRIFDAKGRPIAGATVLVKGTAQGTSTNANGEYALQVPADAELLVSSAGCEDQLLDASETDGSLDVTLERRGRGKRRE